MSGLFASPPGFNNKIIWVSFLFLWVSFLFLFLFSLIVKQCMEKELFHESVFVFTNRQRNHIKILYWEIHGFCLWYKVLEQERFKWPDASSTVTYTLTGQELNWLLDGFDIGVNKSHKKLHLTSVS